MKAGIIMIGAGGHAKVVIDTLLSLGEQVDFCISDSQSVSSCMGVPVLVGDQQLERLQREGYWKCFVAVGSNKARQRLGRLATSLGYQLVNAISPRAIVSSSVRIGRGVAVMPGATINADSVLDDLVVVNTSSSIDHDCRIAEAAHIGPQCALAGGVRVGERSFLGIGSVVIPNVAIEKDSMIGAGAVVISNVSPNVTVVGVPAKILKHNKAHRRTEAD